MSVFEKVLSDLFEVAAKTFEHKYRTAMAVGGFDVVVPARRQAQHWRLASIAAAVAVCLVVVVRPSPHAELMLSAATWLTL